MGEITSLKTIVLDQGWEIQNSFYDNIYKKAEHLLETRNNTLHTRICYHYALILLEAEGGDPRVVLPAILLHDVGYSQLPEKEIKDSFGPIINKPELQRLHELEGVRLAGKILREIDYPADMILSVQALIDGHDTRETAHDINDMIVKDADKLWRYSHEGFFLNFQWFDLDPQAYMERLTSKIPVWFFLETAKILAAGEAEKRKQDLIMLK
jgi:HD superfamily phosphodiesterase